MSKSLLSYIKSLSSLYKNHSLSNQEIIDKIHAVKSDGLKQHINVDNYLYRNGIFNKTTAIESAKYNLKKFSMFPSRKKKFQDELNSIQSSNQHWFENYGIHDSPYHDLIKLTFDDWKMIGLLSSLICDLYVGTANEGSTVDLMK